MSSGRHLRVRSSRAGAGDHERATTTRRGLAGCVRASWSRAHAGSDTGLGSWGRAEGEGWTGCGCGAGSSNRQQRERRVRFERHKLTLNCLFFCLLGPRTSRTSTRGLSSGVCHLRTLAGADSRQGAPGACHTTRAGVGTDLEIVAFFERPRLSACRTTPRRRRTPVSATPVRERTEGALRPPRVAPPARHLRVERHRGPPAPHCGPAHGRTSQRDFFFC